MSEMPMTTGDSVREVAQAVLQATFYSVRTDEPLFIEVGRRLSCRITEYDVVYAIGWLAGLADACDRGIHGRVA